MSRSRSRSAHLVSSIPAVLALACSAATTAPVEQIRVRLASTDIRRGPDGYGRADFVVENTGDDTVGVVQCGPTINPDVERWQGGRWTSYAGGICIAIYPSVPVPLAPNAARAGTTSVGGAGRYRLWIAVNGGHAPSPAFTVH